MDLARELGVNPSSITHFLNGNMSSVRLREYFIKKGCPEELLGGNWIGEVQRERYRCRVSGIGNRKRRKR